MNAEIAAASIRDFQETFAAVRREIARVVVGHDEAIDTILAAFFAGGHVLIEGVPGHRQDADRALARRGAGPALQPHPVHRRPDAGRHHRHPRHQRDARTGRREFVFVPGPIFAHLLLGRRDQPRHAEDAVGAARGDGRAAGDGGRHDASCSPSPFFVLATLNPIEMEGTYQLPEAQLDRFLFKVLLDYPSQAELERILAPPRAPSRRSVRPVLAARCGARRASRR